MSSPPVRLIQEIADNRAIAFVGSGLSLAAGLPDWPGLLKDLIEEAKSSDALTDGEYTDLKAWCSTSEYLMLADALVHTYGRDRFADWLVRRFRVAAQPTDVHRTLAQIPFAAYITTNYDTLLEDAWALEDGRGKQEGHRRTLTVHTIGGAGDLRDPFRGGPFLVKIHGDIGSPKTLVLGLGEFRTAIHDNRMYRIFLQDIFRRYTVLFLGHSLTDPDVLNMLDELVAIFDRIPGNHFALMDEDRISRLKAGVFARNYGIEVLRYRKSAPNHPEVLAFVQRLRDGVTKEQSKAVTSMNVQIVGDASSARLAQVLGPVRVDVVPPIADASSGPPKPPRYTETAPHANLRDYCLANLGTGPWQALEEWYKRLETTPAGHLLRVNLDRESARDDLAQDVWLEFLQALVRAAPAPDRPFDAFQQVIESNRRRFLLQGKRLDTKERLCRYMKLRLFLNLSVGTPEARERAIAEDTNAIQIGELLLGKPGGLSWCTTPSFALGRDSESIARDLWDGVPGEPVVEILYAPETLSGSDYLRAPTVLDMYSGRADEANILKPAPGQGDWCWTVRVGAAPNWTPLAPAAVHPALRLGGARAQTLLLRLIL